jgi:hypothetical protein
VNSNPSSSDAGSQTSFMMLNTPSACSVQICWAYIKSVEREVIWKVARGRFLWTRIESGTQKFPVACYFTGLRYMALPNLKGDLEMWFSSVPRKTKKNIWCQWGRRKASASKQQSSEIC